MSDYIFERDALYRQLGMNTGYRKDEIITKEVFVECFRKWILGAEQKTGHWITTRTQNHDGEFYCDQCDADAPENKKWDYCPCCGAFMGVISDGRQ